MPETNAFVIRNIRGLRIQARRRRDETGGFDVTRIGPYRVPSSATIFISDPTVLLALKPHALVADEIDTSVDLAFSLSEGQAHNNFILKAAMAAFGPHIYDADLYHPQRTLNMAASDGNEYGCLSYRAVGSIVVVKRGNCTFAVKMARASEAGALAVLVLSNDEELLVPSAEETELTSLAGQIPLLLLPKSAALSVETALEHDRELSMVVLPSTTESRRQALADELAKTPVIVNGHWLANCKLAQP